MLINGTYDGKEVIVEIDDNGSTGRLLFQYLAPIDMTVDRGEFTNLRSLSAQLRSDLSYRDCCDLLFRHGIPKDSGLWALNHDGYPSDSFIKLHFPEHTDE